MATVNSHVIGISPASKAGKNLNGSSSSSQTVCEFISLPHVGVRKSMVVNNTIKFIEQKKQTVAFSPNRPTFQTCFMSASDFMVKTAGASDSEKGEIPAAPEIGVAVFIVKDNKVLFGRRRSLSIGGYTYGLPGGHLEFGESFEECAAREVKEETGLEIKNIEFLTAANHRLSDSVHVVAIYVRAHLSDTHQAPENVEPNKCEGWNWYDLKNLPEPMFGPLREMLQGGFNPFPTHT